MPYCASPGAVSRPAGLLSRNVAAGGAGTGTRPLRLRTERDCQQTYTGVPGSVTGTARGTAHHR